MGGDNESFENTWADQWGSSYSVNPDSNNKIVKSKSGKSFTKKYSMKFSRSMSKTKEAASNGVGKTKEAASNGMKKVKDGASNGFSWFKNIFRKSSSGKF